MLYFIFSDLWAFAACARGNQAEGSHTVRAAAKIKMKKRRKTMNAIISRKDLEIWADYLLNHSLGGIKPEDVVMIKGEHITWPLMSILQDKISRPVARPM